MDCNKSLIIRIFALMSKQVYLILNWQFPFQAYLTTHKFTFQDEAGKCIKKSQQNATKTGK